MPVNTRSLRWCLAALVLPWLVACQPAGGGAAVKYQQLCSSCHGTSGRGDGPAAAGLVPRPRNLADRHWQASVDDDYLRKVILQGGSAVNLSPSMSGWSHAFSDEELQQMITYLRSLPEQ